MVLKRAISSKGTKVRARQGEEKENFQQIRHYVHFPSECSKTRHKGLGLKLKLPLATWIIINYTGLKIEITLAILFSWLQYHSGPKQTGNRFIVVQRNKDLWF